MAAPALQKTWQGGSTLGGTEFVNVVAGVTPKEALFLVKDAKVGFNSNPWTVIGSSDGVGSSMDGTDRWLDSGDILTWSSGNPRSWIVLQQAALGATFHCLLANPNTNDDPNGDDIIVTYNEGGFGVANGGTDGTASILPTPSDILKSFGPPSTDWAGAEGGAPTAKVLTCLSSTDGECTRFLLSKQSTGLPINMWGIEVPRLPPSEWTVPAVTYMFKSTVASGLSCLRWETMQASGANMRGLVGAQGGGVISAGMVPMGPMWSTVEVIDFQEDTRPNPMLYPVRLWGGDYLTTILNHGTLFDWYWCSRNPAGQHLLDEDTIPSPQDSTPQNAAFFPADTSNPNSSLQLASGAPSADLRFTTAMTLEFWVNLTSYNDGQNGSYCIDGSGFFGFGYKCWIQNNGFTFNVQLKNVSANGGTYTALLSGAAALGTWVHCAVTREVSNGEVKMFVNGTQIGATIIDDIGDNIGSGANETWTLGENANSLTDVHGYMAEVRAWNTVRTPAEISANYQQALVGNEAGLVAYWPLHTDFNDLTSNANNLTAVAGAATAAPSIDPIARPFAGDIVAPRTLVCTGDNVIGWLDDGETDLKYVGWEWSGVFDNIPLSTTDLKTYLDLSGLATTNEHLWASTALTGTSPPDTGDTGGFDMTLVVGAATNQADADFAGVARVLDSANISTAIAVSGSSKFIPAPMDGTKSFLAGITVRIDLLNTPGANNYLMSQHDSPNGWYLYFRDSGHASVPGQLVLATNQGGTETFAISTRQLIQDEPFTVFVNLDIAAGLLKLITPWEVITTPWVDLGDFSTTTTLHIFDNPNSAQDAMQGAIAHAFSFDYSSAVNAFIGSSHMNTYLLHTDGKLIP